MSSSMNTTVPATAVTSAPQTAPSSTSIPTPTVSPQASVTAKDDKAAAPAMTPAAAPNVVPSPPAAIGSRDVKSTDPIPTPVLDASATSRTGGTPAPQVTPPAPQANVVSAAAPTTHTPALNVPAAPLSNTVRRAGSSSSLNHAAIEHENDLMPVTAGVKSRRASDANTTATTPALAAAATTPHTTTTTTTTSEHAAHRLTHPSQPHTHAHVTLYAGRARKGSTIPTGALMVKSPYFKKLLSETPEPTAEQLTFEEVEDPAMALFAQWVQGHSLGVPSGEGQWHEVGHLIGLYAAGRKWGCEELGNNVVDVLRAYYSNENMTATPYRLETIYTLLPTSTTPPVVTASPLHSFLVQTAAWRCLRDNTGISESMKEVLGKNNELMVDFVNALIKLGRDDAADPRYGSYCAWHDHVVTKKCVEEAQEPWAAD